MKKFSEFLSEVYKNTIPTQLRLTPQILTGEGFDTLTKSILPGHVILSHYDHSAGTVHHVWAKPVTQPDQTTGFERKFSVRANITRGKPGEWIYSNLDVAGVGGGHGPHAYFDIMSGRAARGEDEKPRYGILVHDSMSPGAIQLMRRVKQHYGDKITRHTYTPEPGEPERGVAKDYTHGVHSSMETPPSLARIGTTQIVQFANREHRVKE